MAYELNESQEALHAANNKWQSDNMHVTAQINALRAQIQTTEQRAADAFARDSAAHARELVSSQDDLSKLVTSSEKVQRELTALNIDYVKQLEALKENIAQHARERQTFDQMILDKDIAIVNLTAHISTSMEIDTDDTEVLKDRLAE
eukprot:57333-Heterocapsa_arctica.AAC.1